MWNMKVGERYKDKDGIEWEVIASRGAEGEIPTVDLDEIGDPYAGPELRTITLAPSDERRADFTPLPNR